MENFILCIVLIVAEALRLLDLQKQPLEVFYKRSWSQKFRNTYKKTLVLESLFDTVEIKMTLQQRRSTVNIAKFLRAPILKNICEQLLLDLLRMTFRNYHLFNMKSLLRPIVAIGKYANNLRLHKQNNYWYCTVGICEIRGIF